MEKKSHCPKQTSREGEGGRDSEVVERQINVHETMCQPLDAFVRW